MSLQLTRVTPRRSWAGVPAEEYRQAENQRIRQSRRTPANAARDLRRASHDVTFIAVDGEGTGTGKDHKYVVLGVGQGQITNPDGITWWDAFAFLYSQYQPSVAYVGFFLGYDWTQILKGLPYNRAKMLLDKAEIKKRERRSANRQPFPVMIDVPGEHAKGCDHGEDEVIPADHVHVQGRYWQFDMLPPARRFRLRPKYCRCKRSDCAHMQGADWMYVCDAGPFFQTSLLSVINPRKWDKPIVTEEEYALIKRGKENRDSAVLDDDMLMYNRLENEVLARLMRRLNEGFTEAGIRLARDQWFGPGQAAQAWMLQQDELTERKESAVPAWVRDIAQKTYYGGWFEIMAHGHVPGITWEYDINSAYPCIIARLPCLEHGTWMHHRGGYPPALPRGHLRMVHVTVFGKEDDGFIGPMMHRSRAGVISRPFKTRGWYWHHELMASVDAGLVSRIEYHEWVDYAPCDCRPPLRGLAGLYDKRLRVGKNTSAGKSYKLIYNSVYGKFAQSIGHPRYGNPVYASLITAGCRTMILRAIASHPEKSKAVLMVATDGVYFTSPHPKLRISEKLGEWDETRHENLMLFKPGVYWDDEARTAIANGETPEFKSRGVSARALATVIARADQEFDTWDAGKTGFPVVKFKSGFSMVTLLQALQGKVIKTPEGERFCRTWHKAGYVSSGRELEQDSNPAQKRFPILEFDGERKIYRSIPHGQGDRLETTEYDKNFGFEEDEEEYGITDDGPVLLGWRRALLRN